MKSFNVTSIFPLPAYTTEDGVVDYDVKECVESLYLSMIVGFAKSLESHPYAGAVIRRLLDDGEAIYVVAKMKNEVSLIHVEIDGGLNDYDFLLNVAEEDLSDLVDYRANLSTAFARRVGNNS